MHHIGLGFSNLHISSPYSTIELGGDTSASGSPTPMDEKEDQSAIGPNADCDDNDAIPENVLKTCKGRKGTPYHQKASWLGW